MKRDKQVRAEEKFVEHSDTIFSHFPDGTINHYYKRGHKVVHKKSKTIGIVRCHALGTDKKTLRFSVLANGKSSSWNVKSCEIHGKLFTLEPQDTVTRKCASQTNIRTAPLQINPDEFEVFWQTLIKSKEYLRGMYGK